MLGMAIEGPQVGNLNSNGWRWGQVRAGRAVAPKGMETMAIYRSKRATMERTREGGRCCGAAEVGGKPRCETRFIELGRFLIASQGWEVVGLARWWGGISTSGASLLFYVLCRRSRVINKPSKGESFFPLWYCCFATHQQISVVDVVQCLLGGLNGERGWRLEKIQFGSPGGFQGGVSSTDVGLH